MTPGHEFHDDVRLAKVAISQVSLERGFGIRHNAAKVANSGWNQHGSSDQELRIGNALPAIAGDGNSQRGGSFVRPKQRNAHTEVGAAQIVRLASAVIDRHRFGHAVLELKGQDGCGIAIEQKEIDEQTGAMLQRRRPPGGGEPIELLESLAGRSRRFVRKNAGPIATPQVRLKRQKLLPSALERFIRSPDLIRLMGIGREPRQRS